ncbi:uncharacterized protein [Argopecten irradians]|uniref:uncharacterized protein n=1 Tax=Argopecten irradians TaxID=31199 RepID=UPI003711659C
MDTDQCQIQLNSIRRQNTLMKITVKSLSDKCEKLQREKINMDEEICKLKQQLDNSDNIENKQNSWAAQHKEFEKAIEKRDKKMKAKDFEISILGIDLDQAREDYAGARRENDRLASENYQLQDEVASLKRKQNSDVIKIHQVPSVQIVNSLSHQNHQSHVNNRDGVFSERQHIYQQ